MTRNRGEVSPELLDQCMTEVQLGRGRIEASSSQFPEFAGTLSTLLGTANRIREELAPEDPEPAFVNTSHARLLNRIQVTRRGRRQVLPKQLQSARPIWRPAYALAVILLVLGLLLGGAGVVKASAQALPGGSLYVVKRAVEETRLALTWSASGDAGLMKAYSEERLSEASAMAAVGRSDDLGLALAGYDDMIDRLTALAETSGLQVGPGSLVQLQADLERHIEVLQGVNSHSPAAAQVHIDKAIEHSRHNQAVIEQLVGSGNPSDLAPGQQNTPKGPAGKSDDDRGESGESPPEPAGTEKPHGPSPWARPRSTKTKAP
ncbi:MAG TPA: DUF5667 domain-containing protein [Anaerolineales bacterium]|nr:DUF5667 domain-containing protein [Anaerolineales bacterium]